MESKPEMRKSLKIELTLLCKTKGSHKSIRDSFRRELENGTATLKLMPIWSQFHGITWLDLLKHLMETTIQLIHQLLKPQCPLPNSKRSRSKSTELRLTQRSFLMLSEITHGTLTLMMDQTSENTRQMLHKHTLLMLITNFHILPTFQLILIHFFLALKLRKSSGLKRKLLLPLLDFQSQMLGANPVLQTQIQLMLTLIKLLLMPHKPPKQLLLMQLPMDKLLPLQLLVLLPTNKQRPMFQKILRDPSNQRQQPSLKRKLPAIKKPNKRPLRRWKLQRKLQSKLQRRSFRVQFRKKR